MSVRSREAPEDLGSPGARLIEKIVMPVSFCCGMPFPGVAAKLSSAARLVEWNMREKIRGGRAQAGKGAGSPCRGQDKTRQGYMIEMFMTVPGLPERADTISESDLFLRVTAQWCKPRFK